MEEARYHVHPLSPTSILYGRKLDLEESIEEGDYYPNLRGYWSLCSSDGFGKDFRAKDFIVFGGPVIRPVSKKEKAP